MADVRQVWIKIQNGEPLDEEDKATLRVVMKGFAPSSPEYQMANEALGPPNPYAVDSGGGIGLPTMDWASGIGDWLGANTAGEGYAQYGPEGPPGSVAPNNTPPPTTPDQGPDTIEDPRQQNAKLMAEREAALAAQEPKRENAYSSMPDPMNDDLEYERVTNWGKAPGFAEDRLPSPGPISPGYSFSEMRPGDIANAYNDPQLMMRLIASDAGQGPASESMMMPYLQAARALAGMGVLGGSGSMDFEGVQDDPIGSFQSVEEFMDTFNQPGMQFVDQSALRNNILDRAVGQDWSQMTDQYGQPWDHDQIIETTNQAMLASAPFMTNEAAGIMSSKLNAAALEYKHLLATGEISISYPEYLKNTLNADEWFA